MQSRMAQRFSNISQLFEVLASPPQSSLSRDIDGLMLRVVVDSVMPQRQEAFQWLRFGLSTR